MGKYMTREAAINNVKNFFEGVQSDVIDVDDLFIKFGRDLSDDKTNRSWLSNKLTAMKNYNLLAKHYSSRTGKKKLTRLSLTSEGKRALGKDDTSAIQVNESDTLPSHSSQTLSSSQAVDVESLLETVNREIEILQAKLPSFVITFNIRPRREIGVSEHLRMQLKKF